MKKVRVIISFEKDDGTETVRYGYDVSKDDMTYVTAKFDEEYKPYEISEKNNIGDLDSFSKRLVRLIRYAFVEKDDVNAIVRNAASGRTAT